MGPHPNTFRNEVEGDAFFNPNDDGGKAFGASVRSEKSAARFFFQSAERIRGIFVAGFVVLRIGLLTITIKNSDSPSLMERPEGRESGTPLFFVTQRRTKNCRIAIARLFDKDNFFAGLEVLSL